MLLLGDRGDLGNRFGGGDGAQCVQRLKIGLRGLTPRANSPIIAELDEIAPSNEQRKYI